ncbi:MAG TPA: DUF4349 domain-containing protein [Dehalococcoidia bacterium]|nr:DUF4349 domain-containing protein [Dehalococcoidia bacterium]
MQRTFDSHRALRYAVFAVLAAGVLALAAAAVNGRGDSDGEMAGTVAPDAGFEDGAGDLLAQIDNALGKPVDGSIARDDLATLNIDPKKQSAQESASGSGRNGSSGGAVAPSASPVASSPSTALASVDDRKIVQQATLKLQVKNVGDSFAEVGRIATAAGGFVGGSNFTNQGSDLQVATVTLRVPAARYQDVLGELRGLGAKVDAETSNASDVTEQYSDLSARLRNLEATDTQLLTLLGRANTIAEILQVQDRLNNVRSEIEQVKGRMQLFDKLSEMATIGVTLRPLAVPVSTGGNDGLGRVVSEAWDASLAFLGGIAGVLVTVVVFGWWLPLVAAPAYVAWRRLSRPAGGAAAS